MNQYDVCHETEEIKESERTLAKVPMQALFEVTLEVENMKRWTRRSGVCKERLFATWRSLKYEKWNYFESNLFETFCK